MQIDDPELSNLWRETSFAFHLLKQAINPLMSLKDCISDWRNIAEGLAEGKRERVRQMIKLFSHDMYGIMYPP